MQTNPEESRNDSLPKSLPDRDLLSWGRLAFQPHRRTPFNYALTVALSLSLWGLAAVLYLATSPAFLGGTVDFPEQSPQKFDDPFIQGKIKPAYFVLHETIRVSHFYPSVYLFFPQDVLWGIKINGHQVKAAGLPIAVTEHEGHSVDLAPYVHPGLNQLELKMQTIWKDASFRIEVSPWDKWSQIILGVVLLAVLSSLLTIFWLMKWKVSWPVFLVFYGGIALRTLYWIGTPYFVRTYDMDGHLFYIRYVANHFRPPNPHSGWETYQPPLYYFITGALTRLDQICGLVGHQIFTSYQAFSWACSVGCLAAAFWMSHTLYSSGREERKRLYFLAIVAVFPSLIFNATRISNDVLLNLWAFLWLGFLIHFWKQPKWTSWLGLSGCLGLGLLTKANMVPLALISFACLFFIPNVTRKQKLNFAYLGLFFCLVGFGIYYLPRFFHETSAASYVVGNIHGLNPKTRIYHVLLKSLVFNPFKILRYPFVFPWGPRHDYFLEYYFKSAFFGEWWLSEGYKLMARVFISFSLMLFPILLIGLSRCMRFRLLETFPLVLTLLGLFLAHWSFLQIAPFLATQDFRYDVILIIPIAFFLLEGTDYLSTKNQDIAYWGLNILTINCAVYLTASSLLN